MLLSMTLHDVFVALPPCGIHPQMQRVLIVSTIILLSVPVEQMALHFGMIMSLISDEKPVAKFSGISKLAY